LIGLLTENGQIMTNERSFAEPVDDVPQVFYNPYGWTANATMLYLESPKGVGFSYCDSAVAAIDCINNDETTAQDSYEFLVNFFNAYPEYKSHKFYITGESYAGVYIPMLVDEISRDVLHADLNLVGMAIGNGCLGNKVGTCAFRSPDSSRIYADFFYGHGMYSEVLRGDIMLACGEDFASAASTLSHECRLKMHDMWHQLGEFYM
jgi:carboxypeptidase C (cathepsin A)